MDKTFKRAGVFFAIASMVYLIAMLLLKSIPLNLASFGLFFLIDFAIIVAILRAREKDDMSWPWLMIAFTVGTAVVLAILWHNLSAGKSVFEWTWKETLSVVAAVIAMIVWYLKNDKWGVYMSTNAMTIAAIPTWGDALCDPASTDLIFWALSGMGCFLTIFGNPKTPVSRYMPVMGAISNFFVVLLGMRQFL